MALGPSGQSPILNRSHIVDLIVMIRRARRAIAVVLLVLPVAVAGDIEGRVVIQRRLTKRTVTAPASSYARGAGVELGKDADGDPLA